MPYCAKPGGERGRVREDEVSGGRPGKGEHVWEKDTRGLEMLTFASSHWPSSRTREANDEGRRRAGERVLTAATPARGPPCRRPSPGRAPAAPPPTRHHGRPVAVQGVELVDAPPTPCLLVHELLRGGVEGEGAGREQEEEAAAWVEERGG